jgi:hypothetical protein
MEQHLILFSEFFDLAKTQAELDFVSVPVNGDIPLFIDPFAISQRPDPWSQECRATLVAFFERVANAIRDGDHQAAYDLLQHLREPNETRFGLSAGHPRGAGIGSYQAEQLFHALRESTAVKTGFLTSLEECELHVEGIGHDKISDLTTNVIRGHLAEYTRQQCILLGIPTQQLPLGPYYSPQASEWVSEYFELPLAHERPILLVPKVIARFDPAYNHKKYYRQFVLSYLQAEHLDANSSLVRTLKNRRRVVYKKNIEAIFPCTKENLFDFSRKHPEVLQQYRDWLAGLERKGKGSVVEPEDERLIAEALAEVMASIQPGGAGATDYHKLMIGVVEFLFFPNLIYPRKEREIHQGRKRIDIVMENGAQSGILARLHQVRGLPCAFVVFECKNYVTEVSNPELDQIAGRFSANRGRFGMLCCRHFEDRSIFVERCRDTFRDGRGLVVPLDDKTVEKWLLLVAQGQRKQLDQEIAQLIDEIWYS